MRISVKTLITILIISKGLFNPSYAQTNDSISKLLVNDLKQIFSQNNINGFSVAIVNQNGTLFESGFGYSNRKEKKKYTENTIQNIGSISKTFIGITLMKAQELGYFNLDDPINDFLPFKVINPYFPNIPITIRQLATHTSSIRDPSRYERNGYILKEENNGEAKVNRNFRSPKEMMTQSVFLKKILDNNGEWYKKNNFLKNKPGDKFEYSNIGAGLASLVLENAIGESFNILTKKYIFDPLGMSNTGWSFNEVDFSKHSILYSNVETELAFYKLITYPDGGLITSSSDLGKYLSELISGYNGIGSILNMKSYEELFGSNLNDKNHKERNENAYNDEYDMGVFMGLSHQGQIGHTGSDPGVTSFMFFNSKTKIGKILLVNTELNKDGINQLKVIWKKLEEFESKYEHESEIINN